MAVVFGASLGVCVTKTGGGYEISNDTISEAGGRETGGAYDLVCSVGLAAGSADMFQVIGDYASGYVVESGFTGGMEAVFDKFTLSATATAPTGGGYLGGAADVVPGAIINYQLQYSNSGEAAVYSAAGAAAGGTLSDLLVRAQVPSQVQYSTGTITLNGAAQTDAADFPGTDRCSYVGASGVVECMVPMTAGASGTIAFTGVVK